MKLSSKNQSDLKEPTFTNLERVGIMARRLSHDLSNEMTSLVVTVSLLQEQDLEPDLKDDIQILSVSIDRIGGILKRLSELLKERPFLREPYPVSALATDLEQLLKDEWILKNEVTPFHTRRVRVPSLAVKGILDEFSRMGVLPEMNREVRLSIFNDTSVELSLDSVQPLPAESLETRVTLELIRQSGGALTSTSTGYVVHWPLAGVT